MVFLEKKFYSLIIAGLQWDGCGVYPRQVCQCITGQHKDTKKTCSFYAFTIVILILYFITQRTLNCFVVESVIYK